MSVTDNALVGFLSVVSASKLLRFGGQPLELDGLTLVARIILYDSSRLNWRKDFWSLGAFPFWQKWRRYRIQALIFAISMRCQSGHGKYFLTFFFPHHLPKSPSVQSPSFNSEKVWCQINHPIIDPLRSHYSRISLTTLIHSASAIFYEIFVCIKRTTLQTVQENGTNATTCAHFCKWPNFPSSRPGEFFPP